MFVGRDEARNKWAASPHSRFPDSSAWFCCKSKIVKKLSMQGWKKRRVFQCRLEYVRRELTNSCKWVDTGLSRGWKWGDTHQSCILLRVCFVSAPITTLHNILGPVPMVTYEKNYSRVVCPLSNRCSAKLIFSSSRTRYRTPRGKVSLLKTCLCENRVAYT